MSEILKACAILIGYLMLGELFEWAWGWESNWQMAMNAVAFYALIRTFEKPEVRP